ncbi:MAG TPA: hypothetical protein VLG92_05490 [Candidatus Saccharimonadia bacterium]|nr:hypothetical protein [Candidatus Saccharimonadia bacterium]
MKARLTVIYVPGLGDKRVASQQFAVSMWRLWGVSAMVLPMRWADSEPWDVKQQRLLSKIDEHTLAGKQVALVGSSAGAAAVINAYTLRKSQLVGCVLIAGKVNNPNTIGEQYRQANPAFPTCAQACEKSLTHLSSADRKRILSRYALLDLVVPRKDSMIAGAQNRRLHTIGHGFTIGFQLVCGAPGFLHFLKRLAKTEREAD